MTEKTKVYVGMDVHKDSVVIAVLWEGERDPALVKRLSHEPRKLRRVLDRLARAHEVHVCYEASGAGYVLERMIRSWGHACEVVAPSLIPQRPGERRKHDRKDATGARETLPGGKAGGDPDPDRAGGAGSGSGALPGDISARGTEVTPLRTQVPGPAGSGVPCRPELDGESTSSGCGRSCVRGFSMQRIG